MQTRTCSISGEVSGVGTQQEGLAPALLLVSGLVE